MASRISRVRTTWAAIGAAVAVTLGAGGIGITHATLSGGERSSFVPIVPCRLVDTRPGDDNVGERSTPLGAGQSVTLEARGEHGECDLAAGASGLSLNVTALNASQPTYLTLYPTGNSLPTASHLNPSPGQPPTPNAVEVDLNALGQFNVYNGFGTVDVIIDIVGYYEDHDHDDRYYTEAEVTALLAAKADVEAVDAMRDGEYTCGSSSFFPLGSAADYASGTGTRFATGTTQLQCEVHLPVGARVTEMEARFNDTSAPTSLRCLMVYYTESSGSEFQPFSTAFTVGAPGLTTVSGVPPIPLVVTSGTSYAVRCDVGTSAALSIRAAVVSYVFD